MVSNGLKYREIHNSYGRNVPAKAKQRPRNVLFVVEKTWRTWGHVLAKIVTVGSNKCVKNHSFLCSIKYPPSATSTSANNCYFFIQMYIHYYCYFTLFGDELDRLISSPPIPLWIASYNLFIIYLVVSVEGVGRWRKDDNQNAKQKTTTKISCWGVKHIEFFFYILNW